MACISLNSRIICFISWYLHNNFRHWVFILLKQVIEGKIKGEIEVTRRRGRKRKKLLDDLKDRREYSHLKEDALDRTMWRNRFVRSVGPVVRQITEWMNEWMNECGIWSYSALYSRVILDCFLAELEVWIRKVSLFLSFYLTNYINGKSLSWETSSFSCKQGFPTFCGSRNFITVFTRAHHLSLS
jgi:hypothetical protein